MLDAFSLKDKKVLITGASSGIGKSIAQQCAMAGALCVLTARNEDRLNETLNNLYGVGHSLFCSDLSDVSNIIKLVNELPNLDGIVLCAGVVETNLLKFTDEDELFRLFNTNVFSSIRLVRELIKQKKINKNSSVVIISSISGVRCGYVGGSIYGATKGALEGFVKATALELAPQKIRVNTITPGMVESNLLSSSQIDIDQLEIDRQRYPLKRYGKPDEIGFAAVYLLSDATQWMTGTSLLIDGGYTLQ